MFENTMNLPENVQYDKNVLIFKLNVGYTIFTLIIPFSYDTFGIKSLLSCLCQIDAKKVHNPVLVYSCQFL